jgi:hypothetical protein
MATLLPAPSRTGYMGSVDRLRCDDDDPDGSLEEETPPFPPKTCEFLDAAVAHMSGPAPKKSGRPPTWIAKAKGNGYMTESLSAALAREDAAAARTTKLFAFCGVDCQKGSTAERKRADRSDETAEFKATVAQAIAATDAGDISEAFPGCSLTRDWSEYVAARPRPQPKGAYSSKGAKAASRKLDHENQATAPQPAQDQDQHRDEAGLSQLPSLQETRRNVQPIPPVSKPRAHRQDARSGRVRDELRRPLAGLTQDIQ